MTIKGLSSYIKTKYPINLIKISVGDFRGRKIVIDSYGWIYANYIQARRGVIYQTDLLSQDPCQVEINYVWIEKLIKFLNNLVSKGIQPIFIMDGDAPIEKASTKAKRKTERAKLSEKINLIRIEIEERRRLDIFDNCEDLLVKLRAYLASEANIPSENFDFFIEFVSNIGIPCIQAKGDAERLCSILCREGKAAGVYSKDIDTLAFGSPLMIKGFSKDKLKGGNYFDCIRLDDILNTFDFNYGKFLDYCILIGCDYNKNIYRLGASGGYNNIKKFGRVENIPMKFDYSCINLEKCRELFEIVPSDDLIVNRYFPENFEASEDFDILSIIEPNIEFFKGIYLLDEIRPLLNSLSSFEPCVDGYPFDIDFTRINDLILPEIKDREPEVIKRKPVQRKPKVIGEVLVEEKENEEKEIKEKENEEKALPKIITKRKIKKVTQKDI